MDPDIADEVDSYLEERPHMKINLPIFKNGKDAKDAVTYQSWRWDLKVYQHCTPPTLCNKILARLSQRVSAELWYGYNLGQCVDNLG